MPVNEKLGKCNGFTFALVLEHVQVEFLKWNNIRKQLLSRKMLLLQEKEIRKICKKTSKRSPVVTNKHPENQDVFNFFKLSAGMKTYVGTTRSEEKKNLIYMRAIRTEYARINVTRVYQTSAFVKSCSGANTNELDYYVVPMLINEKLNNVVIHIGPAI